MIEGGPGITSISLRGLGAQRSLVLLNGQRPGPAGVRGQVGSFDLNVIPDSIINRVEILKDGASSIYGSDAVAGVVNIITRTSVDRPELNIQYNATEQGGGNTLQVNGAIGFDLLGGQLMLAAEYEDRDPLKWGDRRYLACAQDLAYDPSTGQRIDRHRPARSSRNTPLGNCSTGNVYYNTVVDAVQRPASIFPRRMASSVGPIPGYRPRATATTTYADSDSAYYEDVWNSPEILEGSRDLGRRALEPLWPRRLHLFDGIDWTTEAAAYAARTGTEGLAPVLPAHRQRERLRRARAVHGWRRLHVSPRASGWRSPSRIWPCDPGSDRGLLLRQRPGLEGRLRRCRAGRGR